MNSPYQSRFLVGIPSSKGIPTLIIIVEKRFEREKALAPWQNRLPSPPPHKGRKGRDTNCCGACEGPGYSIPEGKDSLVLHTYQLNLHDEPWSTPEARRLRRSR